MLTVTTTHLKENYIRRNGVPRSDKATLTEHWTRHADWLTVVTVIDDPAFLTEPLVRSDNWYLDPGQAIGVFGCEPPRKFRRPKAPCRIGCPAPIPIFANSPTGTPCRSKPLAAARETLYPEYRAKLLDYKPPEQCTDTAHV